MKRTGFTLIEIFISLAIIAALAAISIPAIYSNVMRIEEASTVESAMNGLRQFFVDARAKSVKNEEAYTLKNITTTSLEFENTAGDQTIYYSLPTGIRTKLTMETTPTTGPFSYLLGMFLKNNGSEYVIEENFSITVKLDDGENIATLSINQGLPELEF